MMTEAASLFHLYMFPKAKSPPGLQRRQKPAPEMLHLPIQTEMFNVNILCRLLFPMYTDLQSHVQALLTKTIFMTAAGHFQTVRQQGREILHTEKVTIRKKCSLLLPRIMM